MTLIGQSSQFSFGFCIIATTVQEFQEYYRTWFEDSVRQEKLVQSAFQEQCTHFVLSAAGPSDY